MSTLSTPATEGMHIFTIEAANTNVEFVVRHLMISNIRGRFGAFEGTIEVAPGSDVPTAVHVSIDAASIDTRVEQRDAHLRSPDFLDAGKFPQLVFAGKHVEGGPGAFRVHGDLTINGVTRQVVLNGVLEGRGRDPWGGERIGYGATTTISRKEFGMIWNQALELGGVAVGDEIKIDLNVQAVRRD